MKYVKALQGFFLLNFQRWCFSCGSFLLFISFISLLCCLGCSLQPCDHLLGKGWPLGSLVYCVFVTFPFGVPDQVWVLDCIDS